MSHPLSARLEALACSCCDTVSAFCPTCGAPWSSDLPDPMPGFPLGCDSGCDNCGTLLEVLAIGWRPRPASLSDPLPTLERAWAMPPAQRPRPAAAAVAAPPAAPPRPPRPAPPAPHLSPCPPDAQRLRLADWAARGMVPRGLAPATIARGYRLRFGLPPRRDPARRASCAYSMRELGASLGALGLAFPADPLAEVWAAVLQALELPSTRMLLSQQARLAELSEAAAVLEVRPEWLGMTASRRPLLEQALAAAIGRPVPLELRAWEVMR